MYRNLMKKSLERLSSRSETHDLHGNVITPPTREEQDKRLERMGCCSLEYGECRYQTGPVEDLRCSMTLFSQTQCEKLSPPRPLAKVIEAQTKKAASMEVEYVPPPLDIKGET